MMIKQNISGVVVGIYKIEEVETGRVYVGSANGIAKRWSNHIARIKNGTHAYFNNINGVRFEILEVVSPDISDEELADLELQYFEYVNRVDGWTLVNKQQTNAHRHKVRSTENMRKAQVGQNNGNSRLSDDDVREIRRLKEEGMATNKIARTYKISDNYCSAIVTGRKR